MSTKLNATCNSILQNIRSSGLHFSSQETPWSIYVTLRKAFVTPRSYQISSVENCARENLETEPELNLLKVEFEKLAGNHKELENAFENLKNDFEDALGEIEDKNKMIEERTSANTKLSEKNAKNKNLTVENQCLETKVF